MKLPVPSFLSPGLSSEYISIKLVPRSGNRHQPIDHRIATTRDRFTHMFWAGRAGAISWTVAVGMISRGEVTLVFAALGTALRLGQAPSRRARLPCPRDGGNCDGAGDASGAQVKHAGQERIARRHGTGSVSRTLVPH